MVSLLVVPFSTNQSSDSFQSTNHRCQNYLSKTVLALLNQRLYKKRILYKKGLKFAADFKSTCLCINILSNLYSLIYIFFIQTNLRTRMNNFFTLGNLFLDLIDGTTSSFFTHFLPCTPISWGAHYQIFGGAFILIFSLHPSFLDVFFDVTHATFSASYSCYMSGIRCT